MREKLLTTREASYYLGISEKDIINLSNANLLPHFKLGGEFLRFRKDDLTRVKPAVKKKYNLPEHKSHHVENFREFIYFNDFYLVSAIIIIGLLWVIIKDIAF